MIRRRRAQRQGNPRHDRLHHHHPKSSRKRRPCRISNATRASYRAYRVPASSTEQCTLFCSQPYAPTQTGRHESQQSTRVISVSCWVCVGNAVLCFSRNALRARSWSSSLSLPSGDGHRTRVNWYLNGLIVAVARWRQHNSRHGIGVCLRVATTEPEQNSNPFGAYEMAACG